MSIKKFFGGVIAQYFGVGGAEGNATNPLSVRGSGTLLDGDTGGHVLRINKGSTGDSGISFQKGFSSRAEIGLTGGDDINLKVSTNGTLFFPVWSVDRNSGVTDFKENPTVLGDEIWHSGNAGTGSGLDADTVDGIHGTALAKLTGASFTGGVSSTSGFTGPGGAITGVNAANLGGQAPSSYALKSGATFTGTINAPVVQVGGVAVFHPNNMGTGSGLDADTVDGIHGTALAKLTGASFTGDLSISTSSTPLLEMSSSSEDLITFEMNDLQAKADQNFKITYNCGTNDVSMSSSGTVFMRATATPTSYIGLSFPEGAGFGGAFPDSVNRLSVNTEAALFSNAGNDIRLTLNKAGETDDSSFLFQNNFSTRAMVGLLADDNLTFKVSEDGLSFKNAIEIDSSTGTVNQPNKPAVGLSSGIDVSLGSSTTHLITYTSLTFNQGNITWDLSLGSITIEQNGLYLISASFATASQEANNGDAWLPSVKINGVQTHVYQSGMFAPNAFSATSSEVTSTFSLIRPLNSSDVITVYLESIQSNALLAATTLEVAML